MEWNEAHPDATITTSDPALCRRLEAFGVQADRPGRYTVPRSWIHIRPPRPRGRPGDARQLERARAARRDKHVSQ